MKNAALAAKKAKRDAARLEEQRAMQAEEAELARLQGEPQPATNLQQSLLSAL
jgi:hypothetical protein